MIKKELIPPLIIAKLKVLLQRLPDHYYKRSEIEKDLRMYEAGYRGEELFKYHLSFLPKDCYHIFHSLRLPHNTNHFQMDVILLSSAFILIAEVKNFAGHLYFHKDGQLIRTLKDMKEGFDNPIYQVKRHQYQLDEFLRNYNFPTIPIESLVIIAKSSTIIEAHENYHKEMHRVIHAYKFLEKIASLEQKIGHQSQLTKQDMSKLSRLLLKHHTPQNPDILKNLKIDKEDILTGVHCPHCTFLPMIRKKAIWICPSCSQKSKDAHIKALEHYALIYGTQMTNQKARQFLHIDSRSAMKNLFTSMNLPTEGSTKGRSYTLPLR